MESICVDDTVCNEQYRPTWALDLGPNYLQHMDSYNKLRPYGICINCAIDGYSRYVVWLKANQSCNPRIVARHFVRGSCADQTGMSISDKNRQMHWKWLHEANVNVHEDPHASKCFLECSSNHKSRTVCGVFWGNIVHNTGWVISKWWKVVTFSMAASLTRRWFSFASCIWSRWVMYMIITERSTICIKRP